MTTIAQRISQRLDNLPIYEQQKILEFTDFLQYQHNNQKSAQKTKRPTHAHPTLSNIVIKYNPTETLTDDERATDVR